MKKYVVETMMKEQVTDIVGINMKGLKMAIIIRKSKKVKCLKKLSIIVTERITFHLFEKKILFMG